MSITPDKAQRIAALAKLEIRPDQAARLAVQMDDILGYMDTLNSLDTSGVEPMYTPVEHVSVLRPDVVRQDIARADLLRNAPETNGESFVVPRII